MYRVKLNVSFGTCASEHRLQMFIQSGLNHHNAVCSSVFKAKLNCSNSIFAKINSVSVTWKY